MEKLCSGKRLVPVTVGPIITFAQVGERHRTETRKPSANWDKLVPLGGKPSAEDPHLGAPCP
jgi:hypothetical protein